MITINNIYYSLVYIFNDTIDRDANVRLKHCGCGQNVYHFNIYQFVVVFSPLFTFFFFFFFSTDKCGYLTYIVRATFCFCSSNRFISLLNFFYKWTLYNGYGYVTRERKLATTNMVWWSSLYLNRKKISPHLILLFIFFKHVFFGIDVICLIVAHEKLENSQYFIY